MRAFLLRYNYQCLLFLLFLLAEFIARPLGEFPLADDWSYTKSTLLLADHGIINIGDWAGMTLVTQILWGAAFIKIFGFSFFILRVSTLLSAFIGLLTFCALIRRISGNKLTAFFSTLILLFNPLYFSLANTFMTDVNFLTLLILACYFAYDFFENKKFSSFLSVFVLSLALILLRQYGIIVPACMTLACLFLKERRNFYVLWGCIFGILIYVSFELYENYLKTVLSSSCAYQFSGHINPTKKIFWHNLVYGFSSRYRVVIIHALFYTFPIAIAVLPEVVKEFKKVTVAATSILVFICVYLLYRNVPLQAGNIFWHMSVGADTSYETISGTAENYSHTYSGVFEGLLNFLKFIFLPGSLVVIALLLIKIKRRLIKILTTNPALIFLLSVLCAYVIMILITDSFFDRYNLPVLTIMLVLLAFISKHYPVGYGITAILIPFFFYVSVFGTRDYFTLNKTKWQAYNDLVTIEKTDASKINVGFEMNCWNNPGRDTWHDFLDLHKFDYLIQFRKEADFAAFRKYPFRRFFPPGSDTVIVFKRELQQ